MNLESRINKLEEKVPPKTRQVLHGWSYETKEEIIDRFCEQNDVTEAERARVDWFVILRHVINMDHTPYQFTVEEKAEHGDWNADTKPIWRRPRSV